MNSSRRPPLDYRVYFLIKILQSEDEGSTPLIEIASNETKLFFTPKQGPFLLENPPK